ncbi:hypothetical protein BDN70DRAFT_877898 [Pholiota conissans]|uniref:MYND-type domain-containing protein n=1 Tax=Pholiota conissans TaxID=109636 RepID=A0A9P6CU67_9AGAR|nr:hypothetical protein BDN70DRAFT_877898 [Pholiota conissans]
MSLIQSTGLNSLSDIFTNPEDSPLCARCILGASTKGITKGTNLVGTKTFWANFTQDLEYWRSLVRFLFAVRTEEETRQMLARLNRCSCRMRDPGILAYHQAGRGFESEVVSRSFVDRQLSSMLLITELLATILSAMNCAHVKSVAKRTAARWPTCPEDLMPFGAKNLVESLIVWSRVLPDNIVIAIATQCIEFCGSLLIPSVIDSGLTRQVIDAGRRLFDRTWETIRLRARSARQAMGRAFDIQAHPMIKYFHIFFRPLSMQQQALVLNGYELKAVQVFSLLTYCADDPRLCLENSCQYRIELAERGLAIYHTMRLYMDPLPPVLLHPLFRKLHNKDYFCDSDGEFEEDDMPAKARLYIDPETSFIVGEHAVEPIDVTVDSHYYYTSVAPLSIQHIRRARSDLYCSARDCPNSMQSTGRDFRRCVGCNVALYCSKRCQSDAWVSDKYPHKVICQILQNMIATAGSDLLFYRLECDHVGFPRDLEHLIVERWMEGSVTLADLLKIEGWTSYKKFPASQYQKTECLPGFEDYDAKVRELSEGDASIQARYLILEKLSPGQGFEALRTIFDAETEDTN